MDQPLPAGPHSVTSLATSFIATRSLRHPPDALLLCVITLLNDCLSLSYAAASIFCLTMLYSMISLSLQVKEHLDPNGPSGE